MNEQVNELASELDIPPSLKRTKPEQEASEGSEGQAVEDSE